MGNELQPVACKAISRIKTVNNLLTKVRVQGVEKPGGGGIVRDGDDAGQRRSDEVLELFVTANID